MPAKTHQDILLMRWALFSVAGLILLVALYYLGLTPVWARELKEAMASAPFLLPPDAPALSPGTGFLQMCIRDRPTACPERSGRKPSAPWKKNST